jgi:hypothetical protein
MPTTHFCGNPLHDAPFYAFAIVMALGGVGRFSLALRVAIRFFRRVFRTKGA